MDFDLKLATRCVDAFAKASGIGCMLTGENGINLYHAGLSCNKCRICALAGKDGKTCRASQHYGLQESKRFGGKYIYFCAMGLTCFTSPILGPHGETAQLTVGPFLMVDEQDYAAYDLLEVARVDRETLPAIMQAVKEIPYVESGRVTALSELLFMAVAFLNNVSDANRMMEKEESERIQGMISDYIFHIKQEGVMPLYPYREEKKFLQALLQGEQTLSQSLLNELLGHIMFSYGGDIHVIRDRAYELLVLISRTALDAGADFSFVEEQMKKFRKAMHDIATVDELCFWLSRIVRTFMDAMFKHKNARYTDLIHRVVQYLNVRYAEKITLEDVAHHVYLSPTYLSRVFKRETGSSLVDFLNRIRIEKSKELLSQPDIRLIDVALQCGFESQSYYNRVFKQSVGMTPQQYRQKTETKH